MYLIVSQCLKMPDLFERDADEKARNKDSPHVYLPNVANVESRLDSS